MNINDPFGRMKDKHQRNYESLCLSLQKVGLTNRVDAQALLVKLRWRGIWGLAFIVPVTLLLALALPEFRIFVLACGALLVFWLSKTSVNSQEYVKRYIQEELAEHVPASSKYLKHTHYQEAISKLLINKNDTGAPIWKVGRFGVLLMVIYGGVSNLRASLQFFLILQTAFFSWLLRLPDGIPLSLTP